MFENQEAVKVGGPSSGLPGESGILPHSEGIWIKNATGMNSFLSRLMISGLLEKNARFLIPLAQVQPSPLLPPMAQMNSGMCFLCASSMAVGRSVRQPTSINRVSSAVADAC